MPHLTHVGANHSNVGGHSSKGYDISRSGCVVSKKWGPIEIIGRGGGAVHWLGQPQTAQREFGSVDEAKQFVDQEIARRERNGYTKLPARKRILAARNRD